MIVCGLEKSVGLARRVDTDLRLGSITSLHFPSASHLVTTSTDATLSLFRTSDWALLKSLKGHSGRINHVDVHPTGRVALSVGKDKTLKMWDLMRGRGASSLQLGEGGCRDITSMSFLVSLVLMTNRGDFRASRRRSILMIHFVEAEIVRFSSLGTHFAVLYPKKIEIYSLTLKLLHTLETKSRFNTLLFTVLKYFPMRLEMERELLCVGTEKGVIEVYTADQEDEDLNTIEDDEEEEEGEEGDGSAEDGDTRAGPNRMTVELIATLGGHTNR